MADWSAAMESEFENLTGRLDTMKRESLRPAIKGDTTGPLPQSVTREILRPIGNQSSLAARLQALQRDPSLQAADIPEPAPSVSHPLLTCTVPHLQSRAQQLFEP